MVMFGILCFLWTGSFPNVHREEPSAGPVLSLPIHEHRLRALGGV